MRWPKSVQVSPDGPGNWSVHVCTSSTVGPDGTIMCACVYCSHHGHREAWTKALAPRFVREADGLVIPEGPPNTVYLCSDGVDYGPFGGYSPDEVLLKVLAGNPTVRMVELERRLFHLFCRSLGNERGTLYPYQDGGIRWAGPHNWVLVRLDVEAEG